MMHRALLALPFLLAGCSSELDLVPDGGFPPACFAPSDGGVFARGLSAPVPGCAAPPGTVGVLDLATLGWAPVGGLLVVPASDPGTALPVVFVFHGAGGSGAGVRARFALEGPSDGGAILVYPNAVEGTWDITRFSPDGRQVDRLIQLLSERYCIDPDRVYLTGFSAGAVFTLYLGCNVPGAFRGMAAVAGSDSRFDTRCCQGPISAIFIHGTQDSDIPLIEGRRARGHTLARDQCSGSTAPDGPHCVGHACPAPWAVDACEWDGDHDIPDWAGAEISRFFSLSP